MNTINVRVNFEKGICYKNGIDLITGDYNSTKLVFNFDRQDGTKIFEMKNPSGEVILVKEIIDNEIILQGVTQDGEVASLFKEAGDYIYEVSLYDGDSKLTSAYDKIKVEQEQVVIDGKVVDAYLPVFDELLKNVNKALKDVETLNLSVEKVDKTTTITITKKDGTTENIEILDGIDGKDGQDGKDGLPGERGEKGDKGEPGETPDLSDYYNKQQTDDKIDEETRDLLQTLSRELKPDEENGGFSSQTIVNVKNKSGATETIMEIDNLDVKTSVPVNSALGTQKGIDMDDRIKVLENNVNNIIPVIEMEESISQEDMKAYNLPQLTLNEEQIKTVINNNVSILKVKYNVTKANGTETDTMVFYTTIDNVENSNGAGVKATTIKINAIRTNDEADIVYHGELLGTGETFASSVPLKAQYIEHRTPIEDQVTATMELKPNKFYKFGQVADLNLTLGTPENEYIYNEYMFEFISGATSTTLTLPDTIKWLEQPSIETNKTYQCSILNNVGILLGVSNE